MPRQYRPQVGLAAPLVDELSRVADTRGDSISELCFHWLITACRMAGDGKGHLLPQLSEIPRAPRGQAVPRKIVRWKQAADRYTVCRSRINAAGSSVPAVLTEAAQAYLEAGGDALAMNWPAKRQLARAA